MIIREKAIKYGLEKHRGQKDDSGHDYFTEHCLGVGNIIEMVTQDPEVIAAAILHDVIEDAGVTRDELAKAFTERVADLVYEVTHEGAKDGYGYFFPRLESKDAILIKFADRLHNLSRMEPWPEKRRKQYLKKSKFWNDGKDRNYKIDENGKYYPI